MPGRRNRRWSRWVFQTILVPLVRFPVCEQEEGEAAGEMWAGCPRPRGGGERMGNPLYRRMLPGQQAVAGDSQVVSRRHPQNIGRMPEKFDGSITKLCH